MTANVIQIEERDYEADRIYARLVKTTPVRKAQAAREATEGSQAHREQETDGDKIQREIPGTHAVSKRDRGVSDKAKVPRHANGECQTEISAV